MSEDEDSEWLKELVIEIVFKVCKALSKTITIKKREIGDASSLCFSLLCLRRN
jgi:hypothetical protein